MAYVTSTEVVDWLGNDTAVRLSTDTGSTVDTALITAIIVRVEGEINRGLRARTQETITQAAYPQTFAMLAGWALAMTVFRLAARRPPVPDEWKKLNDDAKEELDKLAKGEVALPDAALGGTAMDWGSEEQNAAVEDNR